MLVRPARRRAGGLLPGLYRWGRRVRCGSSDGAEHVPLRRPRLWFGALPWRPRPLPRVCQGGLRHREPVVAALHRDAAGGEDAAWSWV